jgi:hypothetical protein
MQIQFRITHHAVRQYIERVLGFRLGRKATDPEVITEFEQATGITCAQLYRVIARDVTPCLPITILNRGTRRVIKGVHGRYVFDEGAVITCYTGQAERDNPQRKERRNERTARVRQDKYGHALQQ